MGRIKDRSDEMIKQRMEKSPFGGSLSFPSGNPSGEFRAEVRAMFRVWDILYVKIGMWTKEEVLLLLKSKRNAICPRGDGPTVLHCPIGRRDELFQIMEEEPGRRIFNEDREGRPYLIIGDKEKHHIIHMDYDGSCDLLMHYK